LENVKGKESSKTQRECEEYIIPDCRKLPTKLHWLRFRNQMKAIRLRRVASQPILIPTLQ